MKQEAEQRSLDWYRARLGNFTGSRVGDLMVTERGGTGFGKTAMSYIYEVAAERSLHPIVVTWDEEFNRYLDVVDITNKAMRYGTEHEAECRDMLEAELGVSIHERGSIKAEGIEHFASSPDGEFEMDEEKCCVEIKCPRPSTYMEYKATIKTAADLKKVNAKYYWQCQSHMLVTGATRCVFATYCEFMTEPLHYIWVERNEDDQQMIRQRVTEANEIITKFQS